MPKQPMKAAAKKVPEGPLNIAVSLRIIRKHRNAPGIDIAGAREAIKRAALRAAEGDELRADRVMREELERRTRLSIDELADLTDHWPGPRRRSPVKSRPG